MRGLSSKPNRKTGETRLATEIAKGLRPIYIELSSLEINDITLVNQEADKKKDGYPSTDKTLEELEPQFKAFEESLQTLRHDIGALTNKLREKYGCQRTDKGKEVRHRCPEKRVPALGKAAWTHRFSRREKVPQLCSGADF